MGCGGLKKRLFFNFVCLNVAGTVDFIDFYVFWPKYTTLRSHFKLFLGCFPFLPIYHTSLLMTISVDIYR